MDNVLIIHVSMPWMFYRFHSMLMPAATVQTITGPPMTWNTHSITGSWAFSVQALSNTVQVFRFHWKRMPLQSLSRYESQTYHCVSLSFLLPHTRPAGMCPFSDHPFVHDKLPSNRLCNYIEAVCSLCRNTWIKRCSRRAQHLIIDQIHTLF